MKKLAVVCVVALLFSVGALFAAEFEDVPWDHWAYDAVASLAEKGIIVGYPDGTFKGARPLTRYEFACALRNAIERLEAEIGVPADVESLKRAIEDLRARVEALERGAPGVPADLANRVAALEQQLAAAATKEELAAVRNEVAALRQQVAGIAITPEDIQTLRRLINEFRDDLATLGVDVDEMRADLDAIAQRLSALEEQVGKLTVSGVATYIMRAEKPKDPANPPIDLNGVALKSNKKLLENLFAGYDVDLNLGLKVNDNTKVAVAVWGRDWTNPSKMARAADTSDIYKIYLTTTVAKNAELTVGKFPFQLTPYTLKLVDPDVYTYIPKFDQGNYIVSGGKLDLDVKPAKVSLFAAANTGAPELKIDVGGPTVDQFAGARIVLPSLVEMVPEIGVTYYRAGLTNPGWVNAYAEVYGANIVLKPIEKLTITGEWAQFRADDDTGAAKIDKDNNAYDAALTYPVLAGLNLKAGYKQIEQNFFAPGYWGRILFARNPSDIKGPYGAISYQALKNLVLTVEGGYYQPVSAGSPIDTITHLVGDVKYTLTSKLGLKVGYEYAEVKDTAGAKDKYGYLGVGLAYDLGKDTALSLLYQNIDLKPSVGAESKGDLIVTQLTVKF